MNKVTKQWIGYIIAYLIPFIAVWVAWIMTAFSFDIRMVFSDGNFWGISVCYWVIVASLSGLFFSNS